MPGPHPAVAATRAAVTRSLTDLPDGSLVLVACSGGPDSLALAAATAFVAAHGRVRAGAVVVDHGLQAGSVQVAEDAAAACRGLGLDPVRVERVAVGRAGGPEAAARAARYAALERAAAELGAAAVLLGHTRDDQAETVLLGLARGSGARSLAGMPQVRGVLRRPFLGLPRADTVAACAAQGLRPWADPTNDALPVATEASLARPAPGAAGAGRATARAPARSRVRSHVLPVLEAELGPGVAAALARTAEQLRQDADVLDSLAAQLLAAARCADGGPGRVLLDVEVLAAAPPAVRRRALLAAARSVGASAGALSHRHAQAMDALVVGWHGQGPAALPGAVAGRACGRLEVTAVVTRRGEHRVDRADMGADLERVLITEEQLGARLDEMARDIDADYAGRSLLVVGVLKGAVMVMADLVRRLHTPVEMDWMAVSSYGSGTRSSGVVRILKDLDTDLIGRHVLIVEDIIDSGLTLSWLLANLRSRGPASVEVATMLRKPDAAKVPVPVRYVGFDIPNEFVVGFGLDYAERYRNLPFVGTLAPRVYR